MSSKVLDLTAGFVRAAQGTGSTAEPTTVNLEAKEFLRDLAHVMAINMRANMLAGKAPNGKAAVPLAASTIWRKPQNVALRGVRTGRLANSIQARANDDGTYSITADEVSPGQLARALGGEMWAPNGRARAVVAAFKKMVRGLLKVGK